MVSGVVVAVVVPAVVVPAVVVVCTLSAEAGCTAAVAVVLAFVPLVVLAPATVARLPGIEAPPR